MPTIHIYDASTREYLSTVDWISPNEWTALPADATTIQLPEQRSGFARVLSFTGDVWEYIEDHRGETGFIDGHPHTVHTLGPLPNGWSYTAPELSPEEAKTNRQNEIMQELSMLDLRSVRPVRAKLAGTATAEDERILSELEARATALRAELATLA